MTFTKLKYDFLKIYSNNQMEYMKIDISDDGTWSKHLTLLIYLYNATYN